MVGRTVGKYRIVEKLGRGGMGTVYKAIDETLDREVAIKTLNADLLEGDAIKRFRAEAVTLAKLRHPRIAILYELTQEDDALLMVMEYVTGETFDSLVNSAGPLPLDRAITLCTRVLEVLEYAHGAGIVHRDLKPANLMITPSGDVKVMDCGIARVLGTEHMTTDGYMMGTPAYMAPEQVRGEEIDGRADLYAMAVVLYRLVTGRLPFKADTAFGMIHSQLTDEPTPPRQFRAELPEWLDATLARALAKSPADRFQTAEQFRAALQNGMGGLTAPVRAAGTGSQLPEDLLRTVLPTMTPAALPMPPVTPPAQPSVSPLSGSQLSVSPPSMSPPSVPQPSPSQAVPAATTVTLRTHHLVLAGALLLALVVGVGVLAYVALKRAAVPLQTMSPPPTAAAPLSTSTSPATEAPATEAPVIEAPAPVAVPATAAAAPPPAQPAKVPPVVPAARAAAADPAGRSSPSTPPLEKASGVDTTPLAFTQVKALIAEGSKSKEQDVSLSFEGGSVVVRTERSDTVLKALNYGSIVSATYSESKRPRWKEAEGVAAVPDAFVGRGFFLSRARNWLTLQSKDDFLILRFDKDRAPVILPAVESRTGVKIQKVGD